MRTRWQIRIYSLALRLLPGWFREQYGVEVLETFETRLDSIRTARGSWAASWFIVRSLLEIPIVAIEVRVGQRSSGVGLFTTGPDGLGLEIRAATRRLRRRPFATSSIILTIAVAVGLTTAVFSVVNGVLINQLPYPESDRLVRIWQTKGDWLDSPNSFLRSIAERFPLSMPTFNDWRAEDLGLEALGVWSDQSFTHQLPDHAEVLRGQAATSGLFDALGVAPALGRGLQPEDDRIGAARVAVLDHGFWRDQFGGRIGAIGQQLILDGHPYSIVGVMPAGFQVSDRSARVWVPFSDEMKQAGRNSQSLQVIGRLAPDTTLDRMAERLATVQARLAKEYPDSQGDVGSRVTSLLDSVVGDVRQTLLFVLIAVGLVHLIASLNIANIFSVGGLRRRDEILLKAALGASAGRLIRSQLIESLILALLGGAAGVTIAWFSIPVLLSLLPSNFPRIDAIAIDGRVLLFGLAVSTATGIIAGIVPALEAARSRPSGMLRARGRASTADRASARIRSALVVAEIAIAFVLLVTASLLATSFLRLWSTERGFDTRGLVMFSAVPDPDEFPDTESRDRFITEIREKVRSIPGVAVTATNQVPLGGSMTSTTYEVERTATTPEETSVIINVVIDDYFDVMSIPIVQGRLFTNRDTRESAPVAIVDRTMAERTWPGEDAVGKRIRSAPDEPWRTVIGIVGSVRHGGLERELDPAVYVPASQDEDRFPMTWVVRARGDLSSVLALAREAVFTVSPTSPVRRSAILEEEISESVAVPRLRTLLSVMLAAMSGLLAIFGVFGVVAVSVVQRSREIGLRIALGAASGTLVRNVIGSGLRLGVTGVLLGLLLAVPLVRFNRELLFQVEWTNLPAYGLVAIGLIVISCAASYFPARRATRVDPARLLNTD